MRKITMTIDCYIIIDPEKNLWVTSNSEIARTCARMEEEEGCFVIDAVAGLILGNGMTIPDLEIPDLDKVLEALQD